MSEGADLVVGAPVQPDGGASPGSLGGEVFLSWQQVAHVSGPNALLPPPVTSAERAFLCRVQCCHVLSRGCVRVLSPLAGRVNTWGGGGLLLTTCFSCLCPGGDVAILGQCLPHRGVAGLLSELQFDRKFGDRLENGPVLGTLKAEGVARPVTLAASATTLSGGHCWPHAWSWVDRPRAWPPQLGR